MFDNVWWWPVLKNLSHLHFIHRMCEVTSFYHDEILMFTRNPSTGERSSKNFQPIQCQWNVSYYKGELRTNFLTYLKAPITEDWGGGQNNVVHGLNPVGQLKWTTRAITPTLRCFLFCFRQSQRTPRNLGDYFRNSKSFLRNIATGPCNVTFFNICHEVRREIDNMKYPLVLI